MMGVTKEGGLVLRLKGLASEGLGADEGLKEVQFFGPMAQDAAPLVNLVAGLGGAASGGGFAAATSPAALGGAPPQTLSVVGAAVIGTPGAGKTAPTALHRQAASFLNFGAH